MRQAHQDIFFLSEDSSTVFGVSLGYGGCAEHETGVSGIKQSIGFIEREFPIGIEDRIVPALSERHKDSVIFREFSVRVRAPEQSGKKTMTLKGASLGIGLDMAESQIEGSWQQSITSPLLSSPPAPYQFKYPRADKICIHQMIDEVLPREGSYGPTSDPLMRATWDKNNAIVSVFGNNRAKALRSLYEALLGGTATLSISGSANPFGRGGLCLCDASKISAQFKRDILERDLSHKALWDRVNATGIIPFLQANNKGYYALSPKIWEGDQLKFFLNPKEQKLFNSGWFTESELRQWAEGRGPVCSASAKQTRTSPSL